MRILSYNIHGTIGIDGRRDENRLISVIDSANADIICLQEVYRRFPNPLLDFVSIVQKRLSQNAIFVPTIGGSMAGYGLLTTCRNKINKVDIHKLPSRRESRKCIILSVNLRNEQAIIVNLHLGLNSEERLNQIRYICNVLSHYRQPIIIAGDFNEPIDGYAVQYLLHNQGMIHLSHDIGMTYPSDRPLHSIDFILSSKTYKSYNSVKIDDQLASDHLPVMVDIRDL